MHTNRKHGEVSSKENQLNQMLIFGKAVFLTSTNLSENLIPNLVSFYKIRHILGYLTKPNQKERLYFF